MYFPSLKRVVGVDGSLRFCASPASSVVEHEALNLRVVGSSPTLGAFINPRARYKAANRKLHLRGK